MSDEALRRLAAFAVIVVALVAAVVSYSHIFELALAPGQPMPLAILLPLSVDGAVTAGGSGTLPSLITRPSHRPPARTNPDQGAALIIHSGPTRYALAYTS